MHTLKGLQERGAGFLSPVLWRGLIYGPAGQRLLARWGEPTGWLTSRCCPPWLGWRAETRQVRLQFLFSFPSLAILPLVSAQLCTPAVQRECPALGGSSLAVWTADPSRTQWQGQLALPAAKLPLPPKLQQVPTGTLRTWGTPSLSYSPSVGIRNLH